MHIDRSPRNYRCICVRNIRRDSDTMLKLSNNDQSQLYELIQIRAESYTNVLNVSKEKKEKKQSDNSADVSFRYVGQARNRHCALDNKQ